MRCSRLSIHTIMGDLCMCRTPVPCMEANRELLYFAYYCVMAECKTCSVHGKCKHGFIDFEAYERKASHSLGPGVSPFDMEIAVIIWYPNQAVHVRAERTFHGCRFHSLGDSNGGQSPTAYVCCVPTIPLDGSGAMFSKIIIMACRLPHK